MHLVGDNISVWINQVLFCKKKKVWWPLCCWSCNNWVRGSVCRRMGSVSEYCPKNWLALLVRSLSEWGNIFLTVLDVCREPILVQQQEHLPQLPQLSTGPLLMVWMHKRNAITLLVKKHWFPLTVISDNLVLLESDKLDFGEKDLFESLNK